MVVLRRFLPVPHGSVVINYECEVSPRTGCSHDSLGEAMCRIMGPPDLPSFGVINGLENRLNRLGRAPWISTDEDKKS
jgi:hypothetical protein